MATITDVIYFDNNATTSMSAKTIKAMIQLCNRGNPSASYASARVAKKLIDTFRAELLRICGATNYSAMITSGGSESNCTVIHSVPPGSHIICSAVEHRSILDAVDALVETGDVTATYIAPNSRGHIPPSAVSAAIRDNTRLICVMHANNETGAINDIHQIATIARRRGIWFHCDAVQTFGKIPITLSGAAPDSISISFHKIHGPPGVGALICSDAMPLVPLIYGSQNGSMRGGTENIIGIAGARAALADVLPAMAQSRETVRKIKKYIMSELSGRIPTRLYSAAPRRGGVPDMEIVFLSELTDDYLAGTILLSVVKHTEPRVCNRELKEGLEAAGIIVSVGSACNTASPNASHVLTAMRADDLVRAGALRISIGDTNTIVEARTFLAVFLTMLKNVQKRIKRAI